MQGFMILAIIGTEKDTLVFYSMEILIKKWSVKYRSRVAGLSACL